MGFSVEMAKEALTLEHGDIDSALNLLLTNPEWLVCTYSIVSSV